MAKLLIWDIDGTLIKGNDIGRRSMSLTLEHIYGIIGGFDHIDFLGKVDSVAIEETMLQNNIAHFNHEEFYYRYSENVLKAFRMGETLEPVEMAKETLEKLSKNDTIYFALGTGNCKAVAIVKLEHVGILEYFETGCFGDEYSSREKLIGDAKSTSETFYGVTFDKEDVFVIGDSIYDIRAGKANGFKTVAYTPSLDKKELFDAEQPTYIIESIEEIIKII